MSPTSAPLAALADLNLADATKAAIERWLVSPRYADYQTELAALVTRAAADKDADALAELAEAFAGPLKIGTGGRRGKVGPGTNRMNLLLVRETAQGLADAMREAGDAPRVVVVYDTRRDSASFAHAAALQLVANDIDVTLLDVPRPTPELSFMVRRLECGGGIVLSASHNPPEDNGIKLYGPDGAQVLGERDRQLMRAIVAAGEKDSLPEASAAQRARLRVLDADAVAREADAPYHAYVLEQRATKGALSSPGFAVAFSPLHGVGHSSVVPILRACGLTVHPVAAQCDPDDGRFSTVASANPEAPASMAMAIELAESTGAQLVLATDPDADRLGACARDPRYAADGRAFAAIDGNRLGVLMLDHVLRHTSPPKGAWVLTTFVTSPLIGTLARAYGVDVVDDLLVGFKHHAGMMRERERRALVFGVEESHGYMRGNDIRDKDGACAAVLLAEAAALAHAEGRTLFDELERIWCRFGYHRERTGNIYVRGLAGKQAIADAMARWREVPPTSIGGLDVVGVADRSGGQQTGSPTRDLPGNVLVYDLAGDGRACRLVLRPSGTEPKLKVYALARSDAGLEPAALPEVMAAVDALIDAVLRDAERQVRANMQR